VDDSCFVPPASYSRLGKCLLFMANPIWDILWYFSLSSDKFVGE
jgi:hypothetical protein